jgi:acyl dehydratase
MHGTARHGECAVPGTAGPRIYYRRLQGFQPGAAVFAQPREEDTAAHRCRRGIRVESLDPPGETMAELYLEDFEVGQVFRGTRRVRVDAADIARFAAEYDPQPFHLDEVVAKESVFKGLAASGWHTAALTMRLLVGSDLRVAGGLIGLGFEELRWPRPVRPGDELRVESEVLEKRESKSRPQQGLLKMRNSTLNQRDEVVQVSVGTLIVPRRRPGPAAD